MHLDGVLHICLLLLLKEAFQEVSFFFFFFFFAMWHEDLSSPTRDGTCTPCSGGTKSYPLDSQGSPQLVFLGELCCICVRWNHPMPYTHIPAWENREGQSVGGEEEQGW